MLKMNTKMADVATRYGKVINTVVIGVNDQTPYTLSATAMNTAVVGINDVHYVSRVKNKQVLDTTSFDINAIPTYQKEATR